MDPPMVSMANGELYHGPNMPTIKDEASLSPADVHVLLVDDERLSRTVVANLLRKCSYQVTTAENGAEAMELLRSQGPFDLVLTDVCMPEVNGIQLLNYVKNNENLRCVPVVMMSSIEQGDTVCECVKGGAEEYLVKPVTRKEVQHIWQHVLRQQQQQQQNNNNISNSNNARATSPTATNSTEQQHPQVGNIPVPDEQPAFSGEDANEVELEAAKNEEGQQKGATTHQYQYQQLLLAHMYNHHHQRQQLEYAEKQSRVPPSAKANNTTTTTTTTTTDDADYASTLHFLALLKNERMNKMRKLESEIALLERDITISALTLDKIEENGAIISLPPTINEDDNNNKNNNNNTNKRKRLEDNVIEVVVDDANATVAAPIIKTHPHMLQANNNNPERVHASMAQLEEAFFSRRTAHPDQHGLDSFGRDLQVLADRRELSLLTSIRSGDLATGHEMVCCADFDADDQHFATLSVSCCVKVFNFQSDILRNGDDKKNMFGDEAHGHHNNRIRGSFYDEDSLLGNTHYNNNNNNNNKVQYPVWQATTRSKLSSVSWNSYISSHLLTSDYDGLIQLWDVNSTIPTKMEVSTFDEHARRVWAVDFSKTDPLIFASASDDATVRVWHVNHSAHTGASVTRIAAPSNVCSVQFSPTNSHLLAAGCANHRAYLYDLRKPDSPLAGVAVGPQRAVSYVRFMAAGSGGGKEQLVTSSTDSTVRLWDIDAVCSTSGGGDTVDMDSNNKVVKVSKPVCSFKGHKNERNFVGLSVTDDGFIACGSEDNSVYCYWKSLPFAISSMSFDKNQAAGGGIYKNNNNNNGAFVSAVSWARGGKHCLAANSQGTLSILSLK